MVENELSQTYNIGKEPKLKFFSQNAILIATILGGPLAAGFLIQKNYNQIGNKKAGLIALILSLILLTIIISSIYYIPEDIFNKIPNIVIPFIYTGLIYLYVDKYQSEILNEHKNKNRPFYESWIAITVGVASMTVLLSGIFMYIFLYSTNFDTELYDNQISIIHLNEENALKLYTIVDAKNSYKTIEFIETVALPAWKENLKILEQLDRLKGLTVKYLEHNEKLRNYTKLRIEIYTLIEKSLYENTKAYELQIAELNKKVDLIIEND